MPVRAPLTIGVLGTGATSRKNAATGISDLIGTGKAKFVLPVTDAHYSDAVKAVADYARRNHCAYEVIVDDTTDELSDVEALLEEATKTHKVTKVPRKLIALIEAAGDKGRLVLAWDDEDQDAGTALELAVDKGIPALDVTQGMEPLALDDDAASEADDEAPAPTSAEPEPEPEQAAAQPVDVADEAQVFAELRQLTKVSLGAVGLVEAFFGEVRQIVREEVTAATKPRPRGRPRKDAPTGS